jgi:hypothetical protein
VVTRSVAETVPDAASSGYVGRFELTGLTVIRGLEKSSNWAIRNEPQSGPSRDEQRSPLHARR